MPDDSPRAPRSNALAASFEYAFSPDGLIVIIAGGVVFGALQLLGMVGLKTIVAMYLAAFLIDIVRTSATGLDRIPDWPDLRDAYEDLIHPFLLQLCSQVVAFGPAVVAALVLRSIDLSLILGLLGVFYYPMALLASAVLNSWQGAMPWVVIPQISSVLPRYLGLFVVILFFSFIFQSLVFLLAHINPILASVASPFVGIASLLIFGRFLGLFYRTNAAGLAF